MKTHTNGWRPVQEAKIEIDLTNCRFPVELHEKLKAAFGFPEDYGANWSAFWDYLDDFCGGLESDCTVVIHGMSSLPEKLREYAQGMLACMWDAEKKYSAICFMID